MYVSDRSAPLPELSPAVREIVTQHEQLRAEVDKALSEYRKRCTEEADLTSELKRLEAVAFLEAGGTVKEKEARALLAVVDLHQDLRIAVALRRSARAVLDVKTKQMDVLAAALNAHNRELKVLGG